MCIKNHPIVFENQSFADLTELFEPLLKQDRIEINGRSYPNVTELLALFPKEQMQKTITPLYTHGDLLLRNVLVKEDASLYFIDIRGESIHKNVPTKISLDFELGKIAHSFYAEIIRENLFTLSIKESTEGYAFDFRFKEDLWTEKLLAFHEAFFDLLKSDLDVVELMKIDPYLLENSKRAAAIHLLTDAINRMVQDPSGKATIAYYLLAVLLLNELHGA